MVVGRVGGTRRGRDLYGEKVLECSNSEGATCRTWGAGLREREMEAAPGPSDWGSRGKPSLLRGRRRPTRGRNGRNSV